MRQKLTCLLLVGLFLIAGGCGGQPSAPVTKLPPNTPGSGGGGNAGGPPPPENRPVAAMGGGGAPAAGAPAAAPSTPAAPEAPVQTDIFGNAMAPRERPVAAMGGGGAPAGGGAGGGGGGTANNSGPRGASGSSAPLGLANGLYPQGMTGGAGGGEMAISGGLQNGLYPQFAAGSGGAGMSNLPSAALGGGTNPTAAAAVAGDAASGAAGATAGLASQFFENAKQLFNEGEDNAAAQNLYAYLLAREDAFEEYPLQWYSGLKEPRAFLRIGIGVTYNRPRDFDGKPPVIGDPVEDDRGGRRGNQPPASDDGILGASGANPGGAGGGSSNSPYSQVDTSTPAGFLLYYTGDYVEKLYQELNTRRKGSKTQFGKLLAQFPERTPAAGSQPAANENVQSQPFPPQGGPPANRPTIALGGGGGAGGGAPPAGGNAGGGAAAGGGQNNANANANRNARNARKLVDLWSGSNASTPERLTTGTLAPGVICLGEGKREELLSRAEKFGLDAVLIFDVRVGEARGTNYTTTTLRLFNVAAPDEQLALGRQLRNNTVMEARDSGRDPVESELARILDEYMDQNLAAEDLPKSLNQENVSKRVDNVLAGKINDPLKTAVEVVGFYRVGLLPEDKVIEALNQLLGEDLADTILNGDEATRVAELQKLVDQN